MKASIGALTGWSATGSTRLTLCPNYHAISTFSPRNLRRSQFYSEQGAVYFPARSERYSRIQPALHSEDDVLRVYEQTARGAEARGMQLNAWVIGMFQPWLGRALPGHRHRERVRTPQLRRNLSCTPGHSGPTCLNFWPTCATSTESAV